MNDQPRRSSALTPAEHIARAKTEAGNGDYESAMVHALIAMAEAQVSQMPVPITANVCPECLQTTFGLSDSCAKPEPEQVSAAARRMCSVLFGEDFDLHEQDDDDRAHYERAASAAIGAIS